MLPHGRRDISFCQKALDRRKRYDVLWNPAKDNEETKADHNQYLLIDVIEDILVIKKINQQFSKAEIKKIQTNNVTLDKKDSIELIEDVEEEENEPNKEYNPLDEVF